MEDGNHTNEFLAVLGHEMRNSLSALQRSLDVWSMRDAELMDDLRHIMGRQLRQLTSLCSDLLDTALVERRGLELHCKHVSIQEVIDKAQSGGIEDGCKFTVLLPLWNEADHSDQNKSCPLRKHKELDEVVLILIALSCLDDEQHKSRAQDSGCNMLLVKTVGDLGLANVLNEASSMMCALNRARRTQDAASCAELASEIAVWESDGGRCQDSRAASSANTDIPVLIPLPTSHCVNTGES